MVANGNVKRKVLFRLLPACNYQILKAIMSVIREVALHEQVRWGIFPATLIAEDVNQLCFKKVKSSLLINYF